MKAIGAVVAMPADTARSRAGTTEAIPDATMAGLRRTIAVTTGRTAAIAADAVAIAIIVAIRIS
jgi:hypothetical protein